MFKHWTGQMNTREKLLFSLLDNFRQINVGKFLNKMGSLDSTFIYPTRSPRDIGIKMFPFKSFLYWKICYRNTPDEGSKHPDASIHAFDRIVMNSSKRSVPSTLKVYWHLSAQLLLLDLLLLLALLNFQYCQYLTRPTQITFHFLLT